MFTPSSSSESGSQSTKQIDTQSLPRPLSYHPNQPWPVPTFLTFHKECISEYNYFLYIDTGKLFTKELFAMATKSDSVGYAMVAFSALTYSIKFKEKFSACIAFMYYEKTVQELGSLLSKYPSPMDTGESHSAIATALLLSSFDVCFFLTNQLIIATFRCYRQ